MTRLWLGLAILTCAVTARADEPPGPLMFRAGASIAIPSLPSGEIVNTYNSENLDTGFELEGDAMFRVARWTGVGIHASVAHFGGEGSYELQPAHPVALQNQETPVIIAATLEQRVLGRIFVAPFVGLVSDRVHTTAFTYWAHGLTYGASLGVDVFRHDGNRLAVFASVAHWDTDADDSEQLRTIYSVGVAYHR
jgi:hypothetical protein